MKTKVIHFLLLAILFASCDLQSLSISEYKGWLKEESNGFLKTKEMGDYRVEVQLLPDEVSSNVSGEGEYVFEVTIKSSKKDRNIRIEVEADKQQSIKNYYSFAVENDFSINMGGVIYHPVLYNFQTGTDLAKDYRMAVVFSLGEGAEDFTLNFDPKYPDVGNMRFKYLQKDLKNKPSIKS